MGKKSRRGTRRTAAHVHHKAGEGGQHHVVPHVPQEPEASATPVPAVAAMPSESETDKPIPQEEVKPELAPTPPKAVQEEQAALSEQEEMTIEFSQTLQTDLFATAFASDTNHQDSAPSLILEEEQEIGSEDRHDATSGEIVLSIENSEEDNVKSAQVHNHHQEEEETRVESASESKAEITTEVLMVDPEPKQQDRAVVEPGALQEEALVAAEKTSSSLSFSPSSLVSTVFSWSAWRTSPAPRSSPGVPRKKKKEEQAPTDTESASLGILGVPPPKEETDAAPLLVDTSFMVATMLQGLQQQQQQPQTQDRGLDLPVLMEQSVTSTNEDVVDAGVTVEKQEQIRDDDTKEGMDLLNETFDTHELSLTYSSEEDEEDLVPLEDVVDLSATEEAEIVFPDLANDKVEDATFEPVAEAAATEAANDVESTPLVEEPVMVETATTVETQDEEQVVEPLEAVDDVLVMDAGTKEEAQVEPVVEVAASLDDEPDSPPVAFMEEEPIHEETTEEELVELAPSSVQDTMEVVTKQDNKSIADPSLLDDKESAPDNVVVVAAVTVETDNRLSGAETTADFAATQNTEVQMGTPEIEETIAPEAMASDETVAVAASEDASKEAEKKEDPAAVVEPFSQVVVPVLEPADLDEVNDENDKTRSAVEETENGAEETHLPETNDTDGEWIMEEEPTIAAEEVASAPAVGKEEENSSFVDSTAGVAAGVAVIAMTDVELEPIIKGDLVETNTEHDTGMELEIKEEIVAVSPSIDNPVSDHIDEIPKSVKEVLVGEEPISETGLSEPFMDSQMPTDKTKKLAGWFNPLNKIRKSFQKRKSVRQALRQSKLAAAASEASSVPNESPQGRKSIRQALRQSKLAAATSGKKMPSESPQAQKSVRKALRQSKLAADASRRASSKMATTK